MIRQRPRQDTRAYRPAPEGLEGRHLLNATAASPTAIVSPITYGFMPDGTDLGGVSSDLSRSMASHGLSDTDWRAAFRRAAAVWQAATGIPFVESGDDGSPLATPGLARGNSRPGEMIRVGGMDLPAHHLGITLLPPPGNLTARAGGDILFNTGLLAAMGSPGAGGYFVTTDGVSGEMAGNIDFRTVAMHELGHILGLGDLKDPDGDAVMGEAYSGPHLGLGDDDLAALSAELHGLHRGVEGAGESMLSERVRLDPGGSTVANFRIEVPGFYLIRSVGDGVRVSLTNLASSGPEAPHLVGTLPVYLLPGAYALELKAVGVGPVTVQLDVGELAFDPESLLGNGVGQAPAQASRLVGPVGSPMPPAVMVDRGGTNPTVPLVLPSPGAGGIVGTSALVVENFPPSTTSISSSSGRGLVGRVRPDASHIAPVGPTVVIGSTALAYNGVRLVAGIEMVVDRGPSADGPIREDPAALMATVGVFFDADESGQTLRDEEILAAIPSLLMAAFELGDWFASPGAGAPNGEIATSGVVWLEAFPEVESGMGTVEVESADLAPGALGLGFIAAGAFGVRWRLSGKLRRVRGRLGD